VHAQPVIAEHALPSHGLRLAVRRQLAPALYGGGVAPERQRQDASRPRQRLEAFDRDEAIDAIQLGAQRRCRIQIGLALRRVAYWSSAPAEKRRGTPR